MAPTPEALIGSIKNKLDHFQIKLDNRKTEFDYYLLAENLLIPLLNVLYDCSLTNPNRIRSNTAGIDLADARKRISFQVTRQTSLAKMRDSIEKTLRHHAGLYDSLYIVCLTKKQPHYSQELLDTALQGGTLRFDASEHIIDISDIAAAVNYLASTPEKLITIDKQLTYVLGGRDEDHIPNEKQRELERFIQTRYIESQYIKQPFDQQLILKYSELFHYISAFEGTIDPKAASAGNLFDVCLKHILDAESENPLIITGPPGSGKSTFLSLLYRFICYKLTPEIYPAIPIYINLQNYFAEPSDEEALRKLELDIDRINEYISGDDMQLIMILDGNDDSFRYSIETSDKLISLILSKFRIDKKIIGMNVSDNYFYVSNSVSSSYNFTSDAESRITLQNISIHYKHYSRIISLYAELNHPPRSAELPAQIEKYLKERIEQFKILRIDFFMLYIFHEKRNLILYKNSRTLSDFYKQFCFEKLRNPAESYLLEISAIAFEFYIKKGSPGSGHAKGWELIHTHLSIRDYLLAFQIIYRLRTIGATEKTFSKQEYECFNFVYTDSINNFCKEIMNADAVTQKFVSDGIYKIFKKVDLTAQTHFCYLMGRFTSPTQKDYAEQYLTLLLEQIDKSNSGKPNRNHSKENQNLLYYRTIFISLIYLGNRKASSIYIQRLLDDVKWNTINRGFHREYYGDIPFDPGAGSLTLEDNVKEDFSNTFTKLHRKLNEALQQEENYNLFEIELFTLCSLAQHRQVHKNGRITFEQVETIYHLIRKVVDMRRIDLGRPIGKYIEFLIDNFYKERYVPLGKLFSKLYNIKNEDRAGWKKRGLVGTEKVSSHIYGAYLIGKICLPDSIEENTVYDKTRILDMILIHDLGEAIVGDKTPDEKTPEHRKNEKRAIESTSLLGTYFGNKLTDIAAKFRDFESRNEDNINVVIANDLDRLENLMQLYTYVLEYNLYIADYNLWVNTLIDGIKSEQGRTIMQMITEHFEMYSQQDRAAASAP